MKKFWRLYRKEVRFLTGPGIGMIAIIFGIPLFMSFIYYLNPNFYHDNILIRSQNPGFIMQFFIRPILSLGSIQSMTTIYAVIFMYSLLYEHFTRCRYQLFALPIQRQTHLTAKLASVVYWWVVIIIPLFIISIIVKFLGHIPTSIRSLPGTASFELMVLSFGQIITGIILMCSLCLIGYTAAVLLRRMPYLVGTVTMIAVYIFVERQRMIIYQFFTRHFPWQVGESALYQVLPWFGVFFPAVAALVIIITALILYERYGEV